MYNNEPFATFREVADAAGLDEDEAFNRYFSSLLPLTLISVDMDTTLSEEESAIAFAHMGVNAPECMKRLQDIVKVRSPLT